MLEKPSSMLRPVLVVVCGFLLLISFSSNVVLESTGMSKEVLGATLAQTQSAPSYSIFARRPTTPLPQLGVATRLQTPYRRFGGDG